VDQRHFEIRILILRWRRHLKFGKDATRNDRDALVHLLHPSQHGDEESHIPTEIFHLVCLDQAEKKRGAIEDWLNNEESNRGKFDPINPTTLPLDVETQDQVLEPSGSDAAARKLKFDMHLRRLGKGAWEQGGLWDTTRDVR
jgi:hypothetical protein